MVDFKKGDWVVITKSKRNWTSSMNSIIGKVIQITETDDGDRIYFNEDDGWTWRFTDGHYRKALPEEIPGYVGELQYEIY